MTQYADLLVELGAQNAEDLSFMTAPELAPMPIIHAKRLIRRAAEAVAEAATYDQVRVERERRDADRAAEAGAKQEVPPFDCKDAGDRERARMAADDDAEIGGRCRSDRPDYRSHLPIGAQSSFRRSADGRLHYRCDVPRISRLSGHLDDRRHARMSLGTDVQPELMTRGELRDAGRIRSTRSTAERVIFWLSSARCI